MPEEARLHAGREIAGRCRDFIDAQDARITLCFYWPIKNEPDLLPLARAMLSAGRGIAFPAIAGQEIVFRRVRNFEDDLAPAAFGIMEPKENCPALTENEESIVFIPGIAFGLTGIRLGYGKGYFDRYLSLHRVISIGVAYDAAIRAHLPKTENDRPVRYICTERRFIEAMAQDGEARCRRF